MADPITPERAAELLEASDDQPLRHHARSLARAYLIEAGVTSALRDLLAQTERERDTLARWKRWMLAQDAAARLSSADFDHAQFQARCARHAALCAYGDRLRTTRQNSAAGAIGRFYLGDAAAQAGCTVADYSAVERGRNPPFDEATTRKLCAWLGCDPQPLLDAAKAAEEVLDA